MKYLLDTCTISQWVCGNTGVLQQLKTIPPEQINISAITDMEVEYGLKINPQRAAKIYPVMNSLFTVVILKKTLIPPLKSALFLKLVVYQLVPTM